MSLKSEPIGPIPEETMRIAKAAFPKGTRFMKMRDELGTLYHDEMFTDLFSETGQPALAPWRLALVPLCNSRRNYLIGRLLMQYVAELIGRML